MLTPQSYTPQTSTYTTGKQRPISALLSVATARAGNVGQKLFDHKPREVIEFF